MLRWHRLCMTLALPLLLYVAVTGVGIQLFDLIALVRHAPASDPDMQMMRQHIYGPPNYSVVSVPDYTAPALPAGLDYVAGIERAASLGHAAAPGAELRLVELRTAEGRPAAHVQVGTRHLMFDLASGRPLPATYLPWPQPALGFSSPRGDIKAFHRFNFLGFPATGLNLLAGIALSIMVFTGLAQYWKLLKARREGGRNAAFWRGGTLWRQLHRWVSVGASVLVAWIAVTGTAVAYDNFAVVLKALGGGGQMTMPKVNPFTGDLSTPMSDAELPAMTHVTLASYAAHVPNTGIKVLRLRYFSGYAQGVVVGADPDTTQHVYNARSGAPMSMSEPGYPFLGFASGWENHQLLKRLHRGDVFGMPGRWLDFTGGLALIYLLVSGAVMYAQLWRRRAKAGSRALVWN